MKEIERAFKLMLTEYPDVLTVQEVAKILGCDDHQVYKMIDYGELFATQFFREKYSNESLANNADLTVLWQLTPEMEVEMAEKLGCDSLRYLPVRELAKAIGIPTMNLCLACVNHEYPTEYGFKLSQRARQIFAKGLAQSRTYES